MGFSSCVIVVVSLLLCCFCLDFGTAIDTITASQFIKDPAAIISANSKFKLGFFSPGNSTNRYVGIWFNNISLTTPVWVANRNMPLNDSSGILRISEDGNLVVLSGRREIFRSSNVSHGVNDSTAQLTDDGNLVLRSSNGNNIWQSFQHISDTQLAKMGISANSRTGEEIRLTSWRSPSDPSVGSFSLSLDPLNIPELRMWNDSHLHWRSGPWNGQVFIGIPGMTSVYRNGLYMVEDDGTLSLSFNEANESSVVNNFLSPEGKLDNKDGQEDTIKI